jgi:glycosyltransferase involved in cell wall biosynthesis
MNHIYQQPQFGEVWFNYPELYKSMVEKFPSGSKFVEIGSWKGMSSSYMAVEIANSGKDIDFYCVDTWEGSIEHDQYGIDTSHLYDTFLDNMKPVREYYKAIRARSQQAVKQFEDESLDFVFIDASHEYQDIKEDIIAWFPKVKKGGVIAGHDYLNSDFPGVEKAVHEIFGDKIVTQETCWIYEKNEQQINSRVFIITPSRRPFNLQFISKTIPQECKWVVVFDKTVKNEHTVENATVIKSNETGFWGNPNRNIGLECIKNNFSPNDNDWIYILDDDNVIHPDWWTNIQPHLSSTDSIITWGQVWASGELRTEPTDTPKIATIDTSQYMVRWSVAKNLRFEHIYEADGIYAEEAAKQGSVKKLGQYLGYYNFLRAHKTGQEIRTNICMISMFKNEAKGILRMLESVWRHIDFYVFQDNGSTDGTPEIVEEFFKDKNIPGFIYNVKEGWVGFGWNRDHLLQTTLQNDHGCDWIMKMDCDEYLEVDDDFDWSYFYNTDIESFHVAAQNPGCIYYRAWIWNAKLPWKFQHDPAHEIIYLNNEKGENFERFNLPRSLRMIGTNDGESYTVPTKYISDALKLEEKMIREGTMLTDTYHFWYIAKSYQDCYSGNFYPLGEAHSKEFARRFMFYFEEYLKYMNAQGIHEMSYFSAFSIGLGHKYLKQYDKAIEWFNKSEQYCPVRNEHIVYLAQTYDELGEYEKMVEQTTRLMEPDRKLPFPDYYFLIDNNIYHDSGTYPQELHNYALGKLEEMKNTINSFSINVSQKPRLWIVDDFYSDPHAVREFALQQEFEPNLNYYKGSRTKEQFIVPGTKEAFEKIMGRQITNWSETHGMCGRFQYCTAEDSLVYHCDGQTFAGMVYLTPNAPYSCGTSLFAHKKTGLRNENDFGDTNVFEGGFYDRTEFELVDTAGNVFNRLVIFDSKCIHSANEYFGTNITNSRLFHLFFFD